MSHEQILRLLQSGDGLLSGDRREVGPELVQRVAGDQVVEQSAAGDPRRISGSLCTTDEAELIVTPPEPNVAQTAHIAMTRSLTDRAPPVSLADDRNDARGAVRE